MMSRTTNAVFLNESEGQFQYRSEVTTTVSSGKGSTPSGIKVTVHIPTNVNDTIRRQKINRIYDILSPEVSL
jgi:hypothetical protein